LEENLQEIKTAKKRKTEGEEGVHKYVG